MEYENKKSTIITAIALLLLLVMVGGATYAFFQAQGGDTATTGVTVKSYTTDSLTFSTGSAISLTADQITFTSSSTSISGSTTAKAELLANNKDNTATYYYDVVLSVNTNNFVYTTDANTAELILTVTDPDGNALTTLGSLTSVSVTDVNSTSISGFDITGVTGDITIASNYAITNTISDTLTDATNHEWNVTVTFVNLNSDQENNTGKNFDATLTISRTATT